MKTTLCWNCANVGKGLCPWDESRGVTPVPGWDAEQVPWGNTVSYIVKACPLAVLEDNDPNRGCNPRTTGKVDMEYFKQLLDENLSIFQIAEIFEVDIVTVSAWKRRVRNG